MKSDFTARQKNEALAAGELIVFAPLIPLGLTVGSYFSAIDEAERKAQAVYNGLTGKQLIEAVGQPLERYRCINESGHESELWIYPSSKVLKGGHVMHLMNQDGKEVVFHVTMKNYWADDPHCQRLEP